MAAYTFNPQPLFMWLPTHYTLNPFSCGCRAVTHYFSMDKARKELLYAPVAYPMSETVEWFRSHGYAAPGAAVSSPQAQMLGTLVRTSIVLILLLLLAQAAGLRFY